jgi:hypothetical protein
VVSTLPYTNSDTRTASIDRTLPRARKNPTTCAAKRLAFAGGGSRAARSVLTCQKMGCRELRRLGAAQKLSIGWELGWGSSPHGPKREVPRSSGREGAGGWTGAGRAWQCLKPTGMTSATTSRPLRWAHPARSLAVLPMAPVRRAPCRVLLHTTASWRPLRSPRAW